MINKQDIQFLKVKLGFFDTLNKEQQNSLIENTSLIKYSALQNIYSPERECVGVLLVRKGELSTYILSEFGRDITLYRLFPGDVCILSASCVLKSITFDVFIDAEKESEVLLINASFFNQLVQQNIFAENFSLKIAVERFSDVMWTMEQVLFMSFDRRLAVFLKDEMVKTGLDTINLTHEQIARYMGSAREVVSRMVKYFASEGIVENHRGHITIIDKEKLKALL